MKQIILFNLTIIAVVFIGLYLGKTTMQFHIDIERKWLAFLWFGIVLIIAITYLFLTWNKGNPKQPNSAPSPEKQTDDLAQRSINRMLNQQQDKRQMNQAISYTSFSFSDIDTVVKLFRHTNLKYADGNYPEEHWIRQFIDNGYARALKENDTIKAALLAEPLLSGGVMLWIMGVAAEDIGKGYGQKLLTEFENEMRTLNKRWIFCNAALVNENFYLRNGFQTSGVNYKEFCKSINNNNTIL